MTSRRVADSGDDEGDDVVDAADGGHDNHNDDAKLKVEERL